MELLISAFVFGVVVWLVMYFVRTVRLDHLKRHSTQLLKTLEDDDEEVTDRILKFCVESANDTGRDISVDHLFFIIQVLGAMFANSKTSPAKARDEANALLTRIDRRMSIDFTREHQRLNEFQGVTDDWLKSSEQLIKLLVPLFPKLPDDDGFVGERHASITNLLSRAHNPHQLIGRLTLAMNNISGSRFTRDHWPDVNAVKQRKGDPEAMAFQCFGHTMLGTLLLNTDIKDEIRIPFPTRFEHTHVLGGTGHGKTQFLQSMILKDLEAALEGKGSLMVIDGQGDLIRKISQLSYFDPDDPNSLADKLMLIDANDVQFPVCLNMFDINEERLNSYGLAERERIFNATISLYEYFFGALLGADLTQKQNVIFKFLARLMFAIPEATIHTLLDVMENGEAYQPYIDQLDATSRRFFKTQFFNKSFADTKEQIARRLWGVISNGTLNRMFSNAENKVDIFDAINSGKIILVNTAKDLLQADGSAIMGRFFIALLVQAAIQRQVIPEGKRRATFAYIDEIQDYIRGDNKIGDLLNQARKYKVGLICAHQNLGQLNTEQRATFAASTSTKFVGGVSAKDARALASDMRTSEEFILSARKEAGQTNFACFVKNVTDTAIKVPVPFGQMEAVETMSAESYQRLIDRNRAKYCADINGQPVSAETITPESAEEETDGGFKLGQHGVI